MLGRGMSVLRTLLNLLLCYFHSSIWSQVAVRNATNNLIITMCSIMFLLIVKNSSEHLKVSPSDVFYLTVQSTDLMEQTVLNNTTNSNGIDKNCSTPGQSSAFGLSSPQFSIFFFFSTLGVFR